MKNHTLKAMAVLMTLFLFQACSKTHNPAAITTPSTSVTTQSCEPKKGNNIFAGDFYAACLASNSGKNIFFSPYSIFSALSMTYEGAKNNTAVQMASVLYLPTDAAARRNGFSELMGAINAPGKNYSLSAANNLWLQNGYMIDTSFTSVLTQYYMAGINNLDFIGNAEGSRQTINDAVASETNNKITNLLPSGSVTDLTRLVLTNAIYMKADWASKFDASKTMPGNFYTTPTSPVPVSFMAQTFGGAALITTGWPA